MEAKEFDFSFRHAGKKYRANLQIMQPHKVPMYRVRVDRFEGKADEVFVFYEVKEKDKRFFYFPLDGYKSAVAETIIKQLRNY